MLEPMTSLLDWMALQHLSLTVTIHPRLDQPTLIRYAITNAAVICGLSATDCVTESTSPQEAIEALAALLSEREVIIYTKYGRSMRQAPILYVPC